MNEVIVRFDHVTKRFGSVTALDEVSFSLGLSSIIGLVGANGSGKSTLLRHIVGLYLPDDGSVSTFSCDAAKLTSRRLGRVGYVHQEGKLLEWMTVEQHIRYVAAYYEHWN
ncbi:MAG: ATP-binding cassette domain-containing protein, partial [Sedimentisphaerales bacterium]|nr:ATP-binding cassette domain-containing protein [Sedimentisphaerales bacterium]